MMHEEQTVTTAPQLHRHKEWRAETKTREPAKEYFPHTRGLNTATRGSESSLLGTGNWLLPLPTLVLRETWPSKWV